MTDHFSIEQLESLLQEKRKEAQAAETKKRIAYESRRNDLVTTLGMKAATIAGMMADLKTEAMKDLLAFRELMQEYGELRYGEKNKGGFSIKNDFFRIDFSSHINKQFDERANLAEAKLKEFLKSFVRNRDKKMYSMLMALLERNSKTGDFDINLINRLYQLENQFDDPNWKDAIRLFKEAYSPSGTAQYIKFSQCTETGSYDNIVLDFAKIKTNEKAD